MAFLVEGCFEFNFGTSPVMMAFLFVSSTPFIAEKFAPSGKWPEESSARLGNTAGSPWRRQSTYFSMIPVFKIHYLIHES